MAERICFPVRNLDGELMAYAGRTLLDTEPKWLLPKGYVKGFYNIERVATSSHLVIVENPFSVVRVEKDTRLPCIASFGSALTDSQLALLEYLPNLRYVTVLFDGDEAGYAGSLTAVSQLSAYWWSRRVELPKDAQPDTVERDTLLRLFKKQAS